MAHKDVLKLLFPIELGGVTFDDDITLEGLHLDEAEARAEVLLSEMSPRRTSELITEWERVYGLDPLDTYTLQKRRDAVIQKMRELGGLHPAYFVQLAATVGYTITIEELPPNSPGYGQESIWIWRVHVGGNQKVLRYFRAGESTAGERLLAWDTEEILEGILQDLKPAHTEIYFVYE